MFYWLAAAIVAAALIGLGAIIARKFPQLALIDVAALPKEKETKKKKEIMHDRVGRLTADWARGVVAAVRPVFAAIRRWFRRVYVNMLHLQRQYAEEKAGPLLPADLRSKIAALLEEAEILARDGQDGLAEKKYIEIIRLDSRHVAAYRGLGQLYLDVKNYAQAKDTYVFLVRMSVREAGREPAAQAEIAKYFLNLSLACRALGDLKGAREALERAVFHAPSNPKHLDLLLDTCILIGDQRRAREIFEQLRTANPENQKLVEFHDRLAAMSVSRPATPDVQLPGKGSVS